MEFMVGWEDGKYIVSAHVDGVTLAQRQFEHLHEVLRLLDLMLTMTANL